MCAAVSVWVFGRGVTACLGVTAYLKIVQGGPPDTSATPAPGIQALGSLLLGSVTRFFPVNPTSCLLEDLGPGGDQVEEGHGRGPRWKPLQGDSDAGTLAHGVGV